MKILTFDIEEWFHILDHEQTSTEDKWSNYEYRLEKNLNNIINLLKNNNQNATFFCLGWIARKFPKLIKQIDEMNFEIGSHSDLHQLVYKQSRKDFKEDLYRSINSIEDITGKKVRIYRAPGFSVKKKDKSWFIDSLISNGIEIDCSIFPAKRAHGGFPEFQTQLPTLIKSCDKTIKEFPMSTYNIFNKKIIFSGGGYFRVLPYPIIKYMLTKSPYVMSYFHPRDFDKNQPVLKDLSLIRRFKSYYGLNSSYKKLDKTINEFKFISLRDADRLIDWKKIEAITI